MEYVWSPWRMDYIQNQNEEGCAFCKEMAQPDGPNNLIIHRGKQVFMILNRFPYTSGHMMAVPYEHTAQLSDLNAETRAEMMELVNLATLVLQDIYHPHGFNVGINIGAAAGAGIAEHIHMHVVPRWSGDTNFMSSLGNTRVLPESLTDTYQRVKQAWQKLYTAT